MHAEGPDQPLWFRPKDVGFELQVEDETEDIAKVMLWPVLSLGGGTTAAAISVHTLSNKGALPRSRQRAEQLLAGSRRSSHSADLDPGRGFGHRLVCDDHP